MPQISQLSEFYASQIFWMLVIFGAVFFLIGRGMTPRVIETIDGRAKRITDDLNAAEVAHRDADAQEKTWQVQSATQRGQAQALIAQAKAAGAKATEAQLAIAGKGIEARLAEAESRIAAARESALAEIETVAAEAAGDIAARVAGLTVDADAARAAVKGVLHG
jgi:F-type H+-transporting ATPase subunit b